MQQLTNEQIKAIIEWLNSWEQLKDTAIPLRFKEDFPVKDDVRQEVKNLVTQKLT